MGEIIFKREYVIYRHSDGRFSPLSPIAASSISVNIILLFVSFIFANLVPGASADLVEMSDTNILQLGPITT